MKEIIPRKVSRDIGRTLKLFQDRERLRPRISGFSIDPPGTTEIDQVVTLVRGGEAPIIAVTIPAVVDYIPQNSHLEKYLRDRGFTIYDSDGSKKLMMPPILSEHVFSLHPGDSKPGLTLTMTFDNAGETIGHQLFRSEVSNAKVMTYKKADQLLGQNQPLSDELRTLVDFAVKDANRAIENGGTLWDPKRGIGLNSDGKLTIGDDDLSQTSFLIIKRVLSRANRVFAKICKERAIPLLEKSVGQRWTSPLRSYPDFFGLGQLMRSLDNKVIVFSAHFFANMTMSLFGKRERIRYREQKERVLELNRLIRSADVSRHGFSSWQDHEGVETLIMLQQDKMLEEIARKLRSNDLSLYEARVLLLGLRRKPLGWESIEADIHRVNNLLQK